MLPLGRGNRLGTAMIAVTVHLLSPGCTGDSPVYSELAGAVAIGREASGLLGRVARFCGPAAEASAPAGTCHLVESRGPAGASSYTFRFESDDGETQLEYRSELEDGVHEVALSGRAPLGGHPHRVSMWSLAVARAGDDFEEAESALRARVEGLDRLIELEEVRYRLREDGAESFYRTYWDSWETARGTFTLDDGLYEGHRSPGGGWHLATDGVVRLDGGIVGEVALGGPRDARRAVVMMEGGEIEL